MKHRYNRSEGSGRRAAGAKEFKKIAVACAIGFAIMGFIGYSPQLGTIARAT